MLMRCGTKVPQRCAWPSSLEQSWNILEFERYMWKTLGKCGRRCSATYRVSRSGLLRRSAQGAR